MIEFRNRPTHTWSAFQGSNILFRELESFQNLYGAETVGYP